MQPLSSIAFMVLVASLTSCATVPEIKYVSSPCLGPAPAAPEYEWGTTDYPGDASAAKVALTDLEKAKDYAAALKTQHSGCR